MNNLSNWLKLVILIVIHTLYTWTYAQPLDNPYLSYSIYKGDTVNIIDHLRLRQGRWIDSSDTHWMFIESEYANRMIEVRYYYNDTLFRKGMYLDGRPWREDIYAFRPSKTYRITYFEKTGGVREWGELKDGLLHGQYKLFSKNGKLNVIYRYKEGRFISIEYGRNKKYKTQIPLVPPMFNVSLEEMKSIPR